MELLDFGIPVGIELPSINFCDLMDRVQKFETSIST